MVWKAALALLAFAQAGPWDNYADDSYVRLSPTTGSVLAQVCKRDWEPGRYDPCGSYLIGIIDGMALAETICMSETVTVFQLSAMIHRALWDHPEQWDLHAISIAQNALLPQYACKK